ncbi:metabolite traffic protein EboE [Hyphomicrobium sulfonivorans]|uniref:metabolite traffic protein EboE n=2 Tax=Hyphomicrobium sulfonivorans TaxID=121290 RepID=UPI001FE694B8|nr:metabolite traffic protein EboE [Hyphomicrobium sulfonivorans]
MAASAGWSLMRLSLPGTPHLTYCTNIHAGETWEEIFAALRRNLPAVKQQVSPDAPMGVGLRLSAAAVDDLADPERVRELKAFLDAEGFYVFTVNAFPYGTFHATRVKEQVYEPDWRTQERLRFTDAAAYILSVLLPEGMAGSISTVPGGFKPAIATEPDIAAIVDNLVACAAQLYALSEASGKHISLALEPEPHCFLETTDEAIAFFNGRVFAPDAVKAFARAANIDDPAVAEQRLRQHLGVCFDVCHAAVEFEDPVASMARLSEAGIAVPKIQLSAALRVPAPDAEAARLLLAFDDGVYLHQTVAQRDGELTRYLDLPEAIAALDGGAQATEWRVHCHVPLFWQAPGVLQSTHAPLIDLLAACRQSALAPHLEVETYTWDVLPADLRASDISNDIARELQWVRSQLGA